MHLPPALLLLLWATPSLALKYPARREYDTHLYYVLEHDPLHGASPAECASALGAELVEQVGELADHWLVRRPKPVDALEQRDQDHPDLVLRALDQLRSRATHSKDARSVELTHIRRVVSSVRSVERQTPRLRVKRVVPELRDAPSSNNPTVVAAELGIKDPIFPLQWHFVNEEFPQFMLNVTGLWKEGINGTGVTAAMVDDGLDYESDDLAPNFDKEGSYDFNDHEPLPKPKLSDDRHGTRCAGEIAAAKNDVCGVGIAHNAKVSGIRILSGPISDADESAALNWGYQKTSLYSCSWGPPDNGRSMDGPSMIIQKAVLNGINKGRGGLGSVFVFASGNGGGAGDQCNFDGYTNSIYSVTVAAVDYKGHHPVYSEACAANMIVMYSSGAGKHIHTTDVGKNTCSGAHGGTSAAAPLAVGIFALALQVRPDLSWRDIQHLCVNYATQINPEDPDWETTAAGRPYSYKYGYGMLDGYKFVHAAESWKTVKPQAWFEMPIVELGNGTMSGPIMIGGLPIVSGGVTSTTTVTKKMLTEQNLEKLEHITIRVWVSHQKRGDVSVALTSPRGIKSVLAGPRVNDDAKTGFVGWQFMTLKHWDEDPVGDWTIRISDQSDPKSTGNFLGWSMTLWGSALDAEKQQKFQLPGAPFVPPSEASSASAAVSTIAAETEGGDNVKTHPNPTAHLPESHGHEPGETTMKAFETLTAVPAATSTAPSNPGYLQRLVSNQTWLIPAFGMVSLFGVAAGIFFWRRRVRRRAARGEYGRIGEDVPMGAMDDRGLTGGRDHPRTRELYDAFGEVSDEDDEDADEETGLARKAREADGPPRPRGLAYHDDFLEDPPTADLPYRDEPSAQHSAVEGAPNEPRG